MRVATYDLTPLRATYGEGAVLIVVAIESVNISSPARPWRAAAIYAGTMHHLFIPFVIAAAAAAITGDNVGFWIGRAGGDRLPRRDGRSRHEGSRVPRQRVRA